MNGIIAAYQRAREDYEYLVRTYGPVHDVTERCSPEDNLERMLHNPTRKASTRNIHVDLIEAWFRNGWEDGAHDVSQAVQPGMLSDSTVTRIAQRHDIPGW